MSVQTFARHEPHVYFEVREDRLCVGGIPLDTLAERIGHTPFYVYERKAMSARVRELRQALPDGIHLHYAMKANPMPALVQHLVSLVDGVDT